MVLTGAEIVVACLKEQGVDTVFGYPGGAILNIYDALYKHADEIRHILTSHEQGASHAADGYARATGKVGVCIATSGPGATNLVTGIATAYMDSIPLVAITCNVGTSLLGKDSFQEIDIAGVVMPITKYSFIVKDVRDLAKVIRRAFSIAKSGRPGPVLVDITKDATANTTEYIQQVPDVILPDTAAITDEDLHTACLLYTSRQVVEEVAKDYPEVTLSHMYVDNCAMQLVMNPAQFDVILTENMFGDILSDEASMVTGSIGMLSSASLNETKFGLYEPSHGSAPDIAGQNKANPIATILSAAMMLRYSLDLDAEADAVEAAVRQVLKEGYRTGDIMAEGCSQVGTVEMGTLIAERV